MAVIVRHGFRGGVSLVARSSRAQQRRSRPTLPLVPVDSTTGKIIDSTGTLLLTCVPEHLVVVEAGVISLELGSVYKRLGSNMTVVEFKDTACPGMN
ncbi:hypothetical protein PF008_g31705 [Phytophthora fragariae]|uniref:FAD/NAD(P)-binding domain-containing protein n=1 Tax=Phytophthora fragariae TaxID=53985 RepID=A0A6G0Q201_9STRA|nr:hypothetical protein PF008_g31705 [Phytophthora fragariae]